MFNDDLQYLTVTKRLFLKIFFIVYRCGNYSVLSLFLVVFVFFFLPVLFFPLGKIRML